jgi:membrane protein
MTRAPAGRYVRRRRSGAESIPELPGNNDRGATVVRQHSRFSFAVRLLARTLSRYADGGPHVAGAIAFRVLFSIFPLVIVLAGIFGIVVQAAGIQADVVDTVLANVPLTEDGKRDLRALLEGATGSWSGLGLIAIVGLLWSGSGMMGAIRYALNRAWDVEDTRPYVQGKLVDLLLVLGAGLLVALAFVFSVGARVSAAYASSALDEIGIGAGAITWLIGLLVPAVLAFLAVAFLYQVVPAARPPGRMVLTSAAFVGVGFAGLQALFGVYLAHVKDFNAVYGSLGAVVAFLFFVYLSASLFLLGAEAAAAVPEVRRELERGEAVDDAGTPRFRQALGLLRGLVVRSPSRPTGAAPCEVRGRDTRRPRRPSAR